MTHSYISFRMMNPGSHHTIDESHPSMRKWKVCFGWHDTPCNTLPCSHGRKVFLLLVFGPVVGEVGHHDGRVQTHGRGSNEAVKPELSPIHTATMVICVAMGFSSINLVVGSPVRHLLTNNHFINESSTHSANLEHLYHLSIDRRNRLKNATHFCWRWHSYQALPCKSLSRWWWERWLCHVNNGHLGEA